MNKLYRQYNDVKEQQRWWFISAIVALVAFEIYHKMSINVLYTITKDVTPKSFARVVAELFIMGAPYIVTQIVFFMKNFLLRELCVKMTSTGNRDLVAEAEKTRPFLNIYFVISIVMIIVFVVTLYLGGLELANTV